MPDLTPAAGVPRATGATLLYAIVPCAGVGTRSGADRPKQYVDVAGAPMVAHTVRALAAVRRLHATLVVLAPDDREFESRVPGFVGERGWVERCGGATRAATVAAGLAALRARGASDADWVLVHDAARCLLQSTWVERLIETCIDDAVGGLLALPVADTLKAEEGGRAAATVARDKRWAAQTPQMFRLGLLSQALNAAGPPVTDEASAVERLGLRPLLVASTLENFKVTYPDDFALAARLLAAPLLGTARALDQGDTA